MKLRNQLYISTLIALIATVLLGGAIFVANSRVDLANQKSNQIDEVVKAAFQLNSISQSYSIEPSIQTRNQWYAKHSQIYILLDAIQATDQQSINNLNSMRNSQKALELIFAQLEKISQTSDSQDKHDRLVGQMTVQLQSIVTGANRLSWQARQDLTDTQHVAYILILSFAAVLLIVVLVITLIINHNIITPITRLTQDAVEIASGNLGHKPQLFLGKNEIGVLGNSINRMADYLIDANHYLEQRVAELKEAQNALLKSETRLRSLLATNPDLIFITDREGRYLEIFTGRDDLLAVPRDIILGKRITEIIPEDIAGEMMGIIGMAIETRQIQEYEYQLSVPSGATWFQARIMAYDVQDETYVMWMARDITVTKEAEARQKRWREMLERVLELGKAVTRITDLDECLQSINRSVRTGLGFDRAGLFLYDEKRGVLRGAYGTSKTGEMEDTSWFTQSVEEYQAWTTVLSSPTGFVFVDDYKSIYDLPPDSEMAEVTQHITVAAWVGEKPVAVISADNGITHNRISDEQAEALRLFAGYAGLAIENARFGAILEQRVVNRTAELQETLKELENFSYTVSHDLRAPLRGISGFAHMLENEYAENLPEPAIRYVERIKDNARSMGELVDGLLTFTRLGRQTLTKQNLDVEALIHQAIREINRKPIYKDVEFTVSRLPECQADRVLTQIVLEHLLNNALKFTRTRHPAQIEIGSKQKDQKTIYFIRDNGVGFDMRYMHKLFGVFQRLHAQDEFEGTGVGLAIVQRIIHKHGGSIWAESKTDQGATFYFTLD